jgi:hypothetical protein
MSKKIRITFGENDKITIITQERGRKPPLLGVWRNATIKPFFFEFFQRVLCKLVEK